MSKVWSHIAFFLGGALLMLIIAWKYMAGDDYTIEIKKLKAKKTVGDVVIPINQDNQSIKPKKKRRKDR